MNCRTCEQIYKKLKDALKAEVIKNGLSGERVSIRCKILTSNEAIGDPEDKDYPLIKGKERMIEADIMGSKGNAFTDEYADSAYKVSDLIDMELDTNRKRADFVAAFNAIFRHLKLCDRTVHCKDAEPRECAEELLKVIGPGKRVLLAGLQPRFLEFLSRHNEVRVVDLDRDNIGTEKFGIMIEPPENTKDAIEWCDLILATGSTLVNCTICDLLERNRPVTFYGVTISAAARTLGLDTFCAKGR